MDKTPPSRFPDRPIESANERWWVAKVKPRQEKQLAFDFIKNGIEYYLPLYEKVTFRPGTNKKRISVVPLFPGYICFAQNTPRDIFITGRVVNIVEVKNQACFIKELSAILMAIEYGYQIQPVDKPVTVKARVEVISGALKGVQGIISSIKNEASLILEVSGLGAASIQMDISQVKII